MERITDKINEAIISLQQPKSNKDSKIYSKDEPKPKFINPYLQSYYDSTDLSLTYVYECCLTLKPLKGIDINDQQVEFWYTEFIKMGWKKKDFDRQFKTVKRATLYNRIDLENWLSTEIMYNQIDLRLAIDRAVNSLIARGNYLKDKDYELTEEDKKAVDLALANEYKFKYENSGWEKRDDYQTERRKMWEDKFK